VAGKRWGTVRSHLPQTLLLASIAVAALSLSLPWWTDTVSYGPSFHAVPIDHSDVLFSGNTYLFCVPSEYGPNLHGCLSEGLYGSGHTTGFYVNNDLAALYIAMEIGIILAMSLETAALTTLQARCGGEEGSTPPRRQVPLILASVGAGLLLLAPIAALFLQPGAEASVGHLAGEGPWSTFFGSCSSPSCASNVASESWGPSFGWGLSLASGGIGLSAIVAAKRLRSLPRSGSTFPSGLTPVDSSSPARRERGRGKQRRPYLAVAGLLIICVGVAATALASPWWSEAVPTNTVYFYAGNSYLTCFHQSPSGCVSAGFYESQPASPVGATNGLATLSVAMEGAVILSILLIISTLSGFPWSTGTAAEGRRRLSLFNTLPVLAAGILLGSAIVFALLLPPALSSAGSIPWLSPPNGWFIGSCTSSQCGTTGQGAHLASAAWAPALGWISDVAAGFLVACVAIALRRLSRISPTIEP
jgi:hypothetical protein